MPVEVTCGEWEWTPAKIVVCITLTPWKNNLKLTSRFSVQNDVVDLKKPLMVKFYEDTRAAEKYWKVQEKGGSPAICAVALNKDAISVLRIHGQLVSDVAVRICEAQ